MKGSGVVAGILLCAAGILILVIAQATGIFFGASSPAGGGFLGSSGIAQMKGAGALGASVLMLFCFVSGIKLIWKVIKETAFWRRLTGMSRA